MKIFLDTNIFIEYFERRTEKDSVAEILNAVEDGKVVACASVGSFYTMAYLVERALKKIGIHRPRQTAMLRMILAKTKRLVSLAPMSEESLTAAIDDERFTDFEDSFQYHCAMRNGCDVLITINKRDYSQVDLETMPILTPKEFINSLI